MFVGFEPVHVGERRDNTAVARAHLLGRLEQHGTLVRLLAWAARVGRQLPFARLAQERAPREGVGAVKEGRRTACEECLLLGRLCCRPAAVGHALYEQAGLFRHGCDQAQLSEKAGRRSGQLVQDLEVEVGVCEAS